MLAFRKRVKSPFVKKRTAPPLSTRKCTDHTSGACSDSGPPGAGTHLDRRREVTDRSARLRRENGGSTTVEVGQSGGGCHQSKQYQRLTTEGQEPLERRVLVAGPGLGTQYEVATNRVRMLALLGLEGAVEIMTPSSRPHLAGQGRAQAVSVRTAPAVGSSLERTLPRELTGNRAHCAASSDAEAMERSTRAEDAFPSRTRCRSTQAREGSRATVAQAASGEFTATLDIRP